MIRRAWSPLLGVILGFALPGTAPGTAPGAETVWIEAEHLHGVRGNCFPDLGQGTKGHWALSGPGIAPEWTQGGESDWLSIACGPDEDQAQAALPFEVPADGPWRLWVRYRDWRHQTEVFALRLEQPGSPLVELVFGEQPVIDEDDEFKLLWNWAFGWAMREVPLRKGPCQVTLLARQKQPGHRQIDCLCLTTDRAYRPQHREKPVHPTWAVLDRLRAEPGVAPGPLAARAGRWDVPAAWAPRTFRDKGFLYLWNVGKPWLDELASNDPKRMLFPFHTDPAWLPKFREAYGGKKDVPIFSDPRIVPLWHGAGPNVLDDDRFVQWLDAHPDRAWGNMMNYIGPVPLTPKARERWPKYRDRYVGNVSGENLGYIDADAKALAAGVRAAGSRAEVLDVLTKVYLPAVAAKQRAVFGQDVPNPYETTIPCQSAEMTAFAHACREWGARAVGYENTASIPSLALRWGFLRGSARQYGGLTATYRSCNFGDSATIFSEQSTYAHPKYVLDNYYDAWAGAGLTWYKFDLWHQYFSGSSFFYHEQGFDEFWVPGGGAAGLKPLQLSPKGRLVAEFLDLTRRRPERGTPVTPVAFLLDRAHGWDPHANQPAYFGLDPELNPDLLRFGDHARMLKEWFKVAFHPYGPKEAEPANGVGQAFLPGVFGDVFDVLVTSPTRLDAVDGYPVVVLGGDVELSQAWGQKLAAYLQAGGTLLVSNGQLSGPGVPSLPLPALGAEVEADRLRWLPAGRDVPTQRFRYRPIQGGEALATAGDGGVVATVAPVGAGRLVFLSIPRGLGIDQSATPLVALLLAHARQGLLPVEVEGEVEWLLNRTPTGWIVLLLNPAGCRKPQHGLVPTDRAQERVARLRPHGPVTGAREWFTDKDLPLSGSPERRQVEVSVPAAGVRIVELR